MTLAWYGHLKLQESGTSSNWPLFGVIVFSWGIAFLAAEGHPGVHLASRVLHHCQHHVSGHSPALEPHSGILPHHLRRLSGIYGQITKQRVQSQVCLDFAESRWNSMKSNDARRTTLENFQ